MAQQALIQGAINQNIAAIQHAATGGYGGYGGGYAYNSVPNRFGGSSYASGGGFAGSGY